MIYGIPAESIFWISIVFLIIIIGILFLVIRKRRKKSQVSQKFEYDENSSVEENFRKFLLIEAAKQGLSKDLPLSELCGALFVLQDKVRFEFVYATAKPLVMNNIQDFILKTAEQYKK